MRRIIPLFVVAAILVGPGLRAHCLVSCAGPDPVVSSSCHEEPDAGAALGAGTHTCLAAAISAARLGPRVATDPAGVTPTPTPGPIPLHTRLPERAAPPLPVADHSPPIASFLTPLRI